MRPSAAGARYADARVMDRRHESMIARNGEVEGLTQEGSVGLGVRALIGSGWGFYAVADLTDEAARSAGAQAAAIARASASVPGKDLELTPVEVRQDSWSNEVAEDPFAVTLAEKGDLLVGATRTMQDHGADIAARQLRHLGDHEVAGQQRGSSDRPAHRRVRRADETPRPSASPRRSGAAIRASAGSTERAAGSSCASWTWPANAARIAEEARELLTAPTSARAMTRSTSSSARSRWRSRSTSRWATPSSSTASSAGRPPSPARSWLDLAQIGSLRFGSELMNITADATLPGALGSFGYDDEGTPAHPVDIVRDGTWVGVLSGRDSAALAGLPESGGAVRADGYNRMPMVRMTNVGLLAGRQQRSTT